MNHIVKSIPGKIFASVFIGELVVLALLGWFFIYHVHNEIDLELSRKLTTLADLYEQDLISESDLNSPDFLEKILREDVLQSFVVNRYAGFPALRDENFHEFEDGGRKVLLGEISARDPGRLLCLVPLKPENERSSYIFLTLQPDHYVQNRNRIFHWYLAAALAVLFSSALFSSFVAYKLIVPRLKKCDRIIDRVSKGDFSVRIEENREQDELGRSFAKVGALVKTIESYIIKLNEMNDTAEALAGALNKDEVLRVVVEVIEKQFEIRCVGIYEYEDFKRGSVKPEQYLKVLDDEGKKALSAGKVYSLRRALLIGDDGPGLKADRSILYVPVVEEGNVTDIMVFSGPQKDLEFDPVTQEFARALSRLMASAFGRIKSLHEITQAESKYRALFMTAEGGIYRATADGKLEEINPALAAMGGFDSVEEMSMKLTETSQAYADLGDRDKVRDTLRSNGRIKDFELYLKKKDGTTFPASLSAHTVKNKHGEIVAIEGFVVDLTERKLREEAERERAAAEAASKVKSEMLIELEKKNDQLKEALEEVYFMQRRLLQSEKASAIGTMAEGIAHDLNNFLAGAVSYPDLLLMKLPEDSELREPLEEVRKAGKQAVSLVNDLLTLSGHPGEAWELKELNRIVDEVLGSLDINRIIMTQPDLQSSAELCRESTAISCYPVHLARALTALFEYNMKMAGKEGTVKVRTQVRDIGEGEADVFDLQPGSHVIITIGNDGPALAEEHLEHIFEPFYLRRISGIETKGGGLELAMTERVVQEHGGVISVESGDWGTTFTISLPAVDYVEEQSIDEEPLIDDVRGSGDVLVVDDEPLQREITGKMLVALGYQPHLVASGEAALNFLEKQPVDLVLLDMLMPPGMNGRETYEKMLQINPGQKALIVSGYSTSTEVQKTIELGAAGLLKKPFTLIQFARGVMSALHPS